MILASLLFMVLGAATLAHGVYDVVHRVAYTDTPEGRFQIVRDGGASALTRIWFFTPSFLPILSGGFLFGIASGQLLTLWGQG